MCYLHLSFFLYFLLKIYIVAEHRQHYQMLKLHHNCITNVFSSLWSINFVKFEFSNQNLYLNNLIS